MGLDPNEQSTREQAIAIFMSSLTDSTFDFLQGVAAVLGHAYSDSAFAVLPAATWIGVADELVECVVEINLEMCEKTANAHDEDARNAELMRQIEEAEARIAQKELERTRKKTEENLELAQRLKELEKQEAAFE